VPPPPFRTVLPWLLAFLIPLTCLRLFMTGQMELSPDEAYYTLWSQRLDLGYYSKGPGVALAIKAGTALLGQTEMGVRFLSPFLALGTSFLAWGWVRRRFGESPAILSLVLLNCAPIFNVGAVVMTIDPLSIFFWMAAFAAFTRGLEEETRGPAWKWWLAAGALTGLGCLAKYTNALMLLGYVLAMIALPQGRRLARTACPWALLLGFAAFIWPPVVWNMSHDWISYKHTSDRAFDNDVGMGIHPLEPLKYLGMHMGVYSPLIFILLLATLIVLVRMAFRRLPEGDKGLTDCNVLGEVGAARLIACFTVPIFLLYFSISLVNAGEPNWTAPGCFTLVLGAGLVLRRWVANSRDGVMAAGPAWRLWVARIGLGIGILMSIAVINADLLRLAGLPLPYERDPGSRLRAWRTTAAEIERLRSAKELELGQPVFLICSNYQVAAALSFYLPKARHAWAAALPKDPRTRFGPPPVYMTYSPTVQNQFSFWPSYLGPDSPWLGSSALFISDKDRDSPPEKLVSTFDTTEPLSIFEITRRGSTVRRLTVFTCRGLKEAAPAPAPTQTTQHP
jgi:4-amino-4-deoxy-L-arabinose transferase-like glycosyltransferase